MSDVQERLAKYEEEWKKERDAREKAEWKLREAHLQLNDATGECRQLRRRMADLEGRHGADAERAETLTTENEQLRSRVAHLEKLHEALSSDAFWEAEIVVPFAEGLELFATLDEMASQPDASLETWSLEVVADLETLTGSFDPQHAERVKRHLLAQWVYVRWLELCHAGREEPL